MKRVMCVWLPRWPIQRLLQTRPELKGRPLALYEPSPRGGFQVRICSRPAADRGIKPAMPLGEAQALAELHCEQHAPHADRAALEQLAWWCQQFTPFVGLEESSAPASLFLDITGCAHLFGGEAALAEHIGAKFAQRDLYVRIAVADTPGAAWGVSHFGIMGARSASEESRALHLASASGSHCVVPPGQRGDFLDPLPIESLRINSHISDALRALDIRSVGQLRMLPRATLPSRFGPDLLWRLDQALGHVPEPLQLQRPPEIIEEEWTADFTLRNRGHIETVLQELLTRIVARVDARGLGVQHLLCTLQCGRQPVSISLRLLNASISVRHLFELLCLQLERRLIPGEVSRVHMRVEEAAPIAVQAITLWDSEGKRCRGPEVERLLERLSSRLGDDAVLRPYISPDAQPECLVRYREWRVASGEWREEDSPFTHHSPLATHHSLLMRPLRMLPAPEGIEALSIVPEGPPIRFRWHGEEHTVRWSWGPERIETGWWRSEHVRRDYYRVETTAGQWFWLFRRRDDAQWFLHGVFE